MKMGFHPHIWSPIENEHETLTILELTDPATWAWFPTRLTSLSGKWTRSRCCAIIIPASWPSTQGH